MLEPIAAGAFCRGGGRSVAAALTGPRALERWLGAGERSYLTDMPPEIIAARVAGKGCPASTLPAVT